MISNLFKAAMSKASSIRGAATAAPGWMKQSLRKAPGLALIGGFGYMELMSTGREYGYGAGLATAAMYSINGPVGLGVMAFSIGKAIGDMSYESQKVKRTSSFSTAKNFDPWGTGATMRQRSQYNLSRGRSALGNEGYLFH
jgi:hypothetical protein